MKSLFILILMTVAAQAWAEVATFSTQDQTLTVPLLSINGTAYYKDVEINLNAGTGKFSILAADKISAAEIGPQSVNVSLETPGTLFTNDTLALLDIQDSRCPTGAQCIVAGQVIIGLQLHDAVTDGLTLLELTLEGNGDIPEAPVKTEKYSFRLLEASPYPDLDTILDDSDYTFRIEYSLNPQ